MISAAPAAKAYLFSALAGSPDFSGISVTWAAPTNDSDRGTEHVYFASTEDSQSWRGMGSRDDDFTLNLVAEVYRAGDDPQGTETRCWQVVAAIQNVVSLDPHLGGILNVAAEVSAITVTAFPADPNGWAARAELRVRGEAVLHS